MVTINVTVIDGTELPLKLKGILAGAKQGVALATVGGVKWITDGVGSGEFVGDANYPDVTATTKLIKAKAGRETVGVWTGNWIGSFDSSVKGLVGTIRGGGGEYGDFMSRWRVDALFMDKRAKRTQEIIEGEIKEKI